MDFMIIHQPPTCRKILIILFWFLIGEHFCHMECHNHSFLKNFLKHIICQSSCYKKGESLEYRSPIGHWQSLSYLWQVTEELCPAVCHWLAMCGLQHPWWIAKRRWLIRSQPGCSLWCMCLFLTVFGPVKQRNLLSNHLGHVNHVPCYFQVIPSLFSFVHISCEVHYSVEIATIMKGTTFK